MKLKHKLELKCSRAFHHNNRWWKREKMAMGWDVNSLVKYSIYPWRVTSVNTTRNYFQVVYFHSKRCACAWPMWHEIQLVGILTADLKFNFIIKNYSTLLTLLARQQKKNGKKVKRQADKKKTIISFFYCCYLFTENLLCLFSCKFLERPNNRITASKGSKRENQKNCGWWEPFLCKKKKRWKTNNKSCCNVNARTQLAKSEQNVVKMFSEILILWF